MARAAAQEIDALEGRIAGTLPADLDGAFYRLGGQWLYPPKFADDIPLHADGFLSQFRLTGGRAFYRARYVETPRLLANREKQRMRFGYYRNRSSDDADVGHISASAVNTTAFAFAGHLFALKEDGLPHDIDPVTLATRGTHDFGGAFKSLTFTAHPKVDGRTGELITFGYQATGPFSHDVFLYVFSPSGQLKNEIRVRMPVLDMIHDMAITQDYILLPCGGFGIDRDALQQGGAMWRWDPNAPARLGILRRDGDGSDLRWFTGPKQCLLHLFNAWSEGERITLDAPFYRGNPFPFLRSIDGSPWNPAFGDAVVRRLMFDLSSSSDVWTEEVLFPTKIGDLGDIDPRRVGHRHRFCYAGHEAPLTPGAPKVDFVRPPWPVANTYVRFDVEARQQSFLRLAAHQSLGECVFVPRAGSDREQNGYLIGVADDLALGTSFLVVADADALEAGPLATVHLPVPAGPQVHGCWVARGELPLWAPS